MNEVQHVRQLWSSVLQGPVDDDTHFFVAGGDSLSAALVVAKVNRRFHAGITLRQLFENPTFEAFSNVLVQGLAAR